MSLYDQTLRELDKAFMITPKNFHKMSIQVQRLRRLLSKSIEVEDFPEEVVFKTKTHFIVMALLKAQINEGHPVLIQEALWCLSNICLSSSVRLDTLINMGMLKAMKQYLCIDNLVNFELIYWGLSNLISENKDAKQNLISNGFIQFIFDNFSEIKKSFKLSSIIAWFLANFMIDCSSFDQQIIQSLLINLKELLQAREEQEIKSEIIFSFSEYIESKNPDYKFLIDLKIIPVFKKLIFLDDYKNESFLTKIFSKLSFCGEEMIKTFWDDDFKDLIIGKINKTNYMEQEDLINILFNLILLEEENVNMICDYKLIECLRRFILNPEFSFYPKELALDVLRSIFVRLNNNEKINFVFHLGYIDCIFFFFELRELCGVKKALLCLEEVLKYGEAKKLGR